jgi:hypothetical protein
MEVKWKFRDPGNRTSHPQAVNFKAKLVNTTGEWKRFRSFTYAHKQLFPDATVGWSAIREEIANKKPYKDYIFEYDLEDLSEEEIIPIENEKWEKLIPRPDIFISNYGRIAKIQGAKEATERMIIIHDPIHQNATKIQGESDGYFCFDLHENGGKKPCTMVLVHKLVAQYFIGECPPKKVIDHRDGNRKNNHFKNLHFVTPSENNPAARARNNH